STAPSPQPEWGTANRIVPLGDAFLELIAVEHQRVAWASPVGRRVAECAPTRSPAFWAVQPDALAPVATRLGLTVTEGERQRRAGAFYSWQVAGLDVAVEQGLPFFIHWSGLGTLPHRMGVKHSALAEPGFSWVEVGDRERLLDWLGPNRLPLRHVQDERVLVR